MLRNRGVNVTERKIRQDVLTAYEYDIFDVPRWRYIQETGGQCRGNYTQQKYRTIPKPVYYTARSSVTNWRKARAYGARRVYLPENEWGASSAESMVFVRNPRYSMGSYYPNEAFERPFRRDFRYPDGYYSRKPSSIYSDDDEMERYQATRYRTGYGSRRQTPLSRKVTRKLSPIFTCDCATSKVKHINKTDEKSKPQYNNHLSKEAKNLSLDICKILSLLRKGDGEDDEYSSLSLLQNIHDFECHNSNSVAITQRVQISPKMPKQTHDDPAEKFKAASGVRSKLEALVSALKQYEAEKMLNDSGSLDALNDPQYNNLIPSEPPSPVQSLISGKDRKPSINIEDENKQKDIVLQTEEPKTSNKNVCGVIKTKKDNMIVERKSLRSRLSWKKREATGLKMSDDISNNKLAHKLSAEKRLSRAKSREKIGSLLQAKKSLSDQKQAQASNKAGLMIKIGGNPQRKKLKIPKEKQKDKMPKTWIRKFLDNGKESKNNSIHIRWNNKAFYTKSSSTIFELVNNVYKQLGIKDYAKSDEISVSDIKKMPKKNTQKSKSRIPKSTNKPKYKQKLKAYMMPQTIVPGPVYMPGKNANEAERLLLSAKLSRNDEKPSLSDVPFKNHMKTISYPSKNYFQIHLPKNFFSPVSTVKDDELKSPSNDKQVYKIIEYETLRTDSIDKSVIDDDSSYQKYLNETMICKPNECVCLNMVQATKSLCFPERSEDWERNLNPTEPESEPTKSRFQIPDYLDHDTASLSILDRSCSLVDKIIQEECLNWMPLSVDSLLWSDNYKKSSAVLAIYDKDTGSNNANTFADIDNGIDTTNHHDMNKRVANKLSSKGTKKVFRNVNNRSFSRNLIRWKESAKDTISESVIGIYNTKPVVLSVFWSLFWGLLKTPKRKRKSAPLDLSPVQPPKIVSEPECSYRPKDSSQRQQPLLQEIQLPSRPIRLVRSASDTKHTPLYPMRSAKSSPALIVLEKVIIPDEHLIVEELPNQIRSFNSVHALETKIDESVEQTLMSRKPQDSINIVATANDTAPETKEESEKKITLQKSTVSMECTGKILEPELPSKPLQLMRFVCSSNNIHADDKIKFVIVPSVPLLQKHLRQLQFLLSVRLVNTSNAEQVGRNLTQKYLKSQPQNHNQCLAVSNTARHISNQQEVILKSDYENIIQDVNENSLDILPNEFDDNARSKQDMTAIKNRKSTKSRNCITQISEVKNNVFPSDKPSVNLNKAASVKLSLKIKKGDKITKISIKNLNSDKLNNKISIQQTNSQEPSVYARDNPMEQSRNIVPDKNVKVFINITNTKYGKDQNKIENPITNHVLEDDMPKEAIDEDNKATNKNSDSQRYPTKDTISSRENSVDKSLRLHSLSKSYPHIDMCGGNELPVYVMKATSPNDINDALPCIENYLNNIAAKKYIKKQLHNTADEIKLKSMENAEEIKRILSVMMLLNANDFAEIAVLNERIWDNNNAYTSRKDRGRKEMINILGTMNMRNWKTSYFKNQSKFWNDEESFDELESGDSISRCNILARKLNSHRRVEIDSGTRRNFSYIKEKKLAASYNIPHVLNPLIQNHNSCQTTIPKLTFSKTMVMRSHRVKPICWYCGEKRPKKFLTKNFNIKESIKEPKRSTWKHDSIVQTNINIKSKKSSLTEYKVDFKNDDLFIKDSSNTNKADILQSNKIKKAVLQIYSEANDGCMVAKIPKYLRL